MAPEEIEEIRAELKKHKPTIIKCQVCEISMVRYDVLPELVGHEDDNEHLCLGCTDIAWYLHMIKVGKRKGPI